MKKRSFLAFIIIAILAIFAYQIYQPDNLKAETSKVKAPEVFVYYLHNNFRCSNCYKIESYTQEAINKGFAKQLKDGTLVFKVINFDEKANKHYVEDYKLYTKAVVLSRINNGKEVKWKNLDKIWTLLGDKNKFEAYIKTETTKFLKGSK